MIGLFGGTFDPVHYGHLRSAVEVREIFSLSELHLIPSANPPHRYSPIASAEQRLRMLELAVFDNPALLADPRELIRHKQSPTVPSYTIDTLQSLRQEFPEQTLVLFIGSDAFNQLNRWHHWQQLFDFAHIVVLSRPGWQPQVMDNFLLARWVSDIQSLTAQQSGMLFFQPITQLDISATAIRAIFAKHRDPSFLLPAKVIEFIRRHQIYDGC